MKKIKSLFSIAIFFLFLVFAFGTHIITAQETQSQENFDQTVKNNTKIGEIGSCSDYYKNGSVEVDVQNNFQTYQAGDPIILTGTIKNTNSSPVTGISIKARLVKDIPEADPLTSEYIILDEFDVLTNKTIDKQGETNFDYSYVLPLNAPTGEYKLLFFAVADNSFDLSGLNFTDNLVATQVEFSVEGETTDHVYLDQTQIMIGDQSYSTSNPFRSYTVPTDITLPIYNSSDTDKLMKVTYTAYSWDSLNPSHKLDTKTETVTVPSKSEYKLRYKVNNSKFPVTYLNIVAEPTEQTREQSVFNEKTIANIRLTNDAVSLPRIEYIGVNTYPLQKGSEATLVTCFANMSNQIGKDHTKIETVLYDQNKNEIARTEYQGASIPKTTALIQKFIPKNDISSFSIISNVIDSTGTVVDTVEKKYDCKDVNSNICSKTQKPLSLWVITAIIALIIGLVVLLFKRKNVNLFKV